MDASNLKALEMEMNQLTWYHTIDLGQGLVTPGFYDHRPFLGAYGFPKELKGQTVLDIGAANGFFTFELERRGAQVTATELPQWMSHDFGPRYQPDMTTEQAPRYLHDPFLFAHKVLGSGAKRQLINIYEIAPESVGMFDLVFCGSVLLHLTDPIKAIWHIQRVTRQAAIIATVIHPVQSPEPLALFRGHERGDVWWLPNREAFAAMVTSAGFQGWEWFSEFRLDYRDGKPGPYHAVIRAWNTQDRPALLADTDMPPSNLVHQTVTMQDPAVQDLRNQVDTYEKMKYIRFARWVHHFGLKFDSRLRHKTDAR